MNTVGGKCDGGYVTDLHTYPDAIGTNRRGSSILLASSAGWLGSNANAAVHYRILNWDALGPLARDPQSVRASLQLGQTCLVMTTPARWSAWWGTKQAPAPLRQIPGRDANQLNAVAFEWFENLNGGMALSALGMGSLVAWTMLDLIVAARLEDG